MIRFLGSKLRSECFTELERIGLRRGERVCEVSEGVCAGVEVLPTENLAWSLLRQKETHLCVFIHRVHGYRPKNVFYLCVNEEGECSNTSGPGTNTGSSLAESESALLRCRALRSPSTSQGSRGGVRGAGGSWREIRGRFRVESRPKSAQKRD